jgi:Z1 domain-containing protein
MTRHEEVRLAGGGTTTWSPALGETIHGLGDYLVNTGKLSSPEEFERVRRDALAIVRRCQPFNSPDGKRTGLVVGYVQSGKTQSMTAVAAIGRDNGCRIIVVLAGVTNLLLHQSAKRFQKDLRGASGRSVWRIESSSDGLGETTAQHLLQAVAEWRNPAFAHLEQRTLVFMVLKNHAHLVDLRDLLMRADLRGIPSLVIDDEADQAGLNTSPDVPQASTTYQQIAAVRAALPHHTYLQYTATPQAPLLIALDDMLSPAFAELVQPGDKYTGGQAFFGPSSTDGLVIPIPPDDLFKPGSPPDHPPPSLVEALRVFFVGCAVAATRGKPVPRSMLVHPSQRTADHGRYLGWIVEIIRQWSQTLRSSDSADKQDVFDEFRAAYAMLQRTDANLPPFDDLAQRLELSLGRVSLKEVNTQDGSEIDWDNADEHILVGGEKLNRGFTVEGLTVTYMPRDAGGWNADTLQQRARFFGYKQSYLSICRLYLHPDVIAAFRSYVRHEEDIRKQLAEHRGRPLREWRRAFFLSAQMRPTRRNVLSDPYYKIPRDRLWFVQRYPHIDPEAAQRNMTRVLTTETGLSFAKRDGFFEHGAAEALLADLFRDLLVSYEVRGNDVASWYGQLVTIGDIIESAPETKALVLRMSGERKRTADAGAVTLHQGRTAGKTGYPGDAKMLGDGDQVTIQIHTVHVDQGDLLPGIAIHIPLAMRRDDTGAMG